MAKTSEQIPSIEYIKEVGDAMVGMVTPAVAQMEAAIKKSADDIADIQKKQAKTDYETAMKLANQASTAKERDKARFIVQKNYEEALEKAEQAKQDRLASQEKSLQKAKVTAYQNFMKTAKLEDKIAAEQQIAALYKQRKIQLESLQTAHDAEMELLREARDQASGTERELLEQKIQDAEESFNKQRTEQQHLIEQSKQANQQLEKDTEQKKRIDTVSSAKLNPQAAFSAITQENKQFYATQKQLQKQRDEALESKDVELAIALDKQLAEEEKNHEESLSVAKEQLKEAKKSAVAAAIAKFLEDATKQIDTKINTFYEHQASYEARLQESGKSYSDSLKTISKNVALSPFVKQTDVVQKFQQLVGEGIAYNVELRAFLGTIAEDIATTFEVNNATLKQIVRLQQEDSSAQRLGMEAYLTRFYNQFFKDSSYLSDAFDSTTAALMEASTRMTNEAGMEFEYEAQKWLGALYSAGMNQNTINTIAQGLGYLGTGDVEALNSNSALTTLFAISAGKANLPYGDILTNGLTAQDTNKLMKAMVEYLSSIADNTKDNNVVAKAYGNVLGITTSDYKSIQTIVKSADAIYNTTMDYQQALGEYEYQTSQIANRVHLSTMVNTLLDNAMTTSATAIGANPGLFALYRVAGLLEDITGGSEGAFSLPFINTFFGGIDLHQNLMGLIRLGTGISTLFGSLLGTVLSGGSVFGNYDLKNWGYENQVSRGSSPIVGGKGIQTGISQETELSSVGNTNMSDVKSSTLASAAAEAEESGKITNASVSGEDKHDFEDLYRALFGNRDGDKLGVKVLGINEDFSNTFGSFIADEVISGTQTVASETAKKTSEAVEDAMISNIPDVEKSIEKLEKDALRVKVVNQDPIAVKLAQMLDGSSPEAFVNAIYNNSQSILGETSTSANSMMTSNSEIKIYSSQLENLLGGNTSSSTVNAFAQLLDGSGVSSVSSMSGVKYEDYSLKNYFIQQASIEGATIAVPDDVLHSLVTLGTSVEKMKTENDAMKVHISNEKLKVDVANFDEAVKTYIENQVALILRNAITDGLNQEDTENSTSSLSAIIRDIEMHLSNVSSNTNEINSATQSIRNNSLA